MGGQDPMTDEQRMEEGRRMFQIFAARMFEQRVLTAYREKVAKERQAKLLEEIEAENQQDAQRKAKKAKEAQRRKDRAARKKEALAEEKARKEAEKAAEEAARKEEEERKQAEAKQRAEEKRKRREAQKKAEEEERLRKEAERQRKIHEREENERKAREAKEREKKAREEARLREKEQKEREARERREQQERDKREKEAKVKAERESREQAKETKEKRKKEERAAQKAAAIAATAAAATAPSVTLPKRPAQQSATAIPALAQSSASFASPLITVATPALPMAPTPVRPRQPSQQESSGIQTSGVGFPPGVASSHSQSPHPLTPIQASPGPIGPPSKSGLTGPNLFGGQASQHAASPLSAQPSKPVPMHPSPFGMPMGGGGNMPFPPGLGQMPPPGFGSPMHRDPPFSPMNAFRPPPGIVSMPPGLSGPGPNRGFPLHQHHPPGFPGPLDSPVPPMAHLMGPAGMQSNGGTTHSRQGSGSHESGGPQPISKPTPIGRPASVVHGQRPSSSSPSRDFSRNDPDTHLGSSALLDDGDDPIDFAGRPVRFPTASSLPRPGGFGAFGMDPMFPSHPNPWGPQPFGMPPQSHPFPPGPPPGFGVPSPVGSSWGPPPGASFGIPGVLERPTEPRHLTLRKMMRKACEDLGEHDTQAAEGRTGFIPLADIKAQVDRLHINGPPVNFDELLMICETEGNEVNGGGIFELREENGNKSIQYFLNNDRARPQGVLRTVGYHPGSPTSGGGLG